MKCSFLLITLFACSTCIGQSGGGAPSHVPSYNNGLTSTYDRYNSIHNKGLVDYEVILKEYENIDGSPYLHGGEILVDLIIYNDSIIKDVPIKYDLHYNEVIAKKEDGSTIVIDQNFFKGFVYNNNGNKESYFRLRVSDNTFYRVLFRMDDFVFYKNIKTRIEKVDHHVPGLDTKQQKFVQRQEYFVMQRQFVHPVKLRKEEAITYFPKEYADQIPTLKKELKIKKLNKEEDYLKIINEFIGPKEKQMQKVVRP
jgi:hypothetical protein